jgi:hypothetical protein
MGMAPTDTGADRPLRFVTACYGAPFWAAAPRWADGIRALHDAPIDIISLDGGQYAREDRDIATLKVDAGEALRYGLGDKIRLAHIAARLVDGVTCIQLDVDVELKRNVAPLVELPYDFIVSRAFAAPDFAAAALGFVACTGFYVAKPSSLPLCRNILRRVARRDHDTDLDQYILNVLLVDAAEAGRHARETVALEGRDLEMDVFRVGRCRIGVLPAEAISRRDDPVGALYGVHHPNVLTRFTADAPPPGDA